MTPADPAVPELPGLERGEEPQRVSIERRDHILVITIDRVDKRNAADRAMLRQLSRAYEVFDRDPELRVAVVRAAGDHFTGGLDLDDILPTMQQHLDEGPAFLLDKVDPFLITGEGVTKPVIVAVQGYCLTWGLELLLAADIAIASDDTVFGQVEVTRGMMPFGGATIRLPQRAGWGNAMRWLLTGDTFDAAEAYRIGVVQQVVPAGTHFDRALELAGRIAAQAPLAVQATLLNASVAVKDGTEAAAAALAPALSRLLATQDLQRGMRAFRDRSGAEFSGR